MKSAPSIFQFVVLVVFILVGIVGVAIFAGFGGVNEVRTPKAIIWGTVSSDKFNELVRLANSVKPVIDVTYIQKTPESFQLDFVNAIAEGTGPDVVLLSDDLLYSQVNKFMVIPFTSYDQRLFTDTFLSAGQHFLRSNGIAGVPFSVDPIVMYWNKSIFANAGIAQPPKNWLEVEKIVPQIRQINDVKGIDRAAVALGESRNVTNAKEILATMLLQIGNPITVTDPQTGAVTPTLDAFGGEGTAGAEDVMEFYTMFSNPAGPLYTWSRSMPSSRAAFLSGDLAIYFGYASEYNSLRLENPNLNFDVALMPQQNPNYSATYGRLTAFSIVKVPRNANEAFSVVTELTSQNSQSLWTQISQMPPVRNDLLSQPVTDKNLSVFYRAAIQTQTWFDPDPVYSNTIFRDLIESITTGLTNPTDALNTAQQRMNLLLRGIKS